MENQKSSESINSRVEKSPKEQIQKPKKLTKKVTNI